MTPSSAIATTVELETAAAGEPVTVEARPLIDEENDRSRSRSSYLDYMRSREPTYYGAWSQPDRRDIAQFRDEHQVFGLWWAYFYYIVFLVILCVIIAIYYIVKYTT